MKSKNNKWKAWRLVMGAESVNKEMQSFQSSIKKLSDGVGKASTLWKDAKYSELSASIGEIAKQSKEIMVTGDRCCSSLKKFHKIAEEKY